MALPAPRKVKGIWTNRKALVTAIRGIQRGRTRGEIIKSIHEKHYNRDMLHPHTLEEVQIALNPKYGIGRQVIRILREGKKLQRLQADAEKGTSQPQTAQKTGRIFNPPLDKALARRVAESVNKRRNANSQFLKNRHQEDPKLRNRLGQRSMEFWEKEKDSPRGVTIRKAHAAKLARQKQRPGYEAKRRARAREVLKEMHKTDEWYITNLLAGRQKYWDSVRGGGPRERPKESSTQFVFDFLPLTQSPLKQMELPTTKSILPPGPIKLEEIKKLRKTPWRPVQLPLPFNRDKLIAQAMINLSKARENPNYKEKVVNGIRRYNRELTFAIGETFKSGDMHPSKGEWPKSGNGFRPKMAAVHLTPAAELHEKQRNLQLGRILLEELGPFDTEVVLRFFGFRGNHPMHSIVEDLRLTELQAQGILNRAIAKLSKRTELKDLLLPAK